MDFPPVIAAPMAGGPSTPALVNAVSFGFLAFGTCSVNEARAQLDEVEGPFGVNLFYPQQFEPSPELVSSVASDLRADVPAVDLTSGFAEKLRLTLRARPSVVSSMFGCFTPGEIDAIHECGASAWVTVTNETDARVAAERGADALVVQGPQAGGHRGTWSPELTPDTRSLTDLLESVGPIGLPMIAAGGVRCAGDVSKLLGRGAASVACGTAFLLADEAGTSAKNRDMLKAGGRTVLSRAFSGRWARGVETEFTRANPDMPPVYPYLKPMVPENPYCLAGENFDAILEAPAAEIEKALTP
ncbi:nitronate monooxygenase [Corynebacterium qintianiae]|uniref:Propionate 3-nitronate monooxygenase n=1 Tax=Corynebacterium qintianiae TaxID=2709392 RepID=A0A7T0KNN3_9CORY|nr:nitronate monooxygenase [Corynebacterium qintianiae]QPK83872.1 nitronate monooxygenase [Corynebacterium qintianiae]